LTVGFADCVATGEEGVRDFDAVHDKRVFQVFVLGGFSNLPRFK
jgi:hypothetical protein